MPNVTYTVVLHQPLEIIFQSLTNFSDTPNWQPEVIKEWSTPEGKLEVGSHVHQIRMFLGKRVESSSEVLELVQSRKMVTTSDPGTDPSVRVSYELEPLDSSETRLIFSITLEGKGLFKLFSPLIKRSLQKDVKMRF